MKDYTGREIQVGDRIVFPRRQGSNMWVTDAVVAGIDHLTGALLLDNKHRLERVDRCVVITFMRPQTAGLHYYIHQNGYQDDTAYVVVNDWSKEIYCVDKRGRRSSLIYTPATFGQGVANINQYVAEGSWIEVMART